jgi:Mrp family chromosome partitioning ATPase/capsular polysaccharide biosynthesis protein
MEFREYVSVLRSRRSIIFVVLVLFTAAAVAAAAVRPATYTAEARLLVAPASPASALLGIQGMQSFQPDRDMSTHAELVRSPAVAEVVIERLGLKTTAPELLERIEVQPVGGSDLLAIRAEAPGPGRASSLANSFARAYADQREAEFQAAVGTARERLEQRQEATLDRLAEMGDDAAGREPAAATLAAIEQQLETLGAGDALGLAGARLAVPASADRATSGSGMRGGALIGLAMGLVVGVAAAFTAEHFDTRVRGASDVAKHGVPVIGGVLAERSSRGTVALLRDPASAAADSYRMLRRSLGLGAARDGEGNVLLVSSPVGPDASQSVAGNLAVALAQAGARVTLIDCDFRRSPLQSLFGLQNTSGLGEVLAGSRQLGEVVQRPIPALGVVTTGTAPQSPADALGSSRMRAVVREAAVWSDWLIVHAPPVLDHSDALALLDDVSRVLLVVRVQDTRVDEVGRAVALLDRFGAGVETQGVLWGVRRDAKDRDLFTSGSTVGTTSVAAVPAERLDTGEVLAQ